MRPKTSFVLGVFGFGEEVNFIFNSELLISIKLAVDLCRKEDADTDNVAFLLADNMKRLLEELWIIFFSSQFFFFIKFLHNFVILFFLLSFVGFGSDIAGEEMASNYWL